MGSSLAPSASQLSEIGLDQGACLLDADNGEEFEGNASATPLKHSLLKDACALAFHKLKAAAEVCFHPAVDVLQAVWESTPRLAHPLANGDHVVLPEALNNHKKHRRPCIRTDLTVSRRTVPECIDVCDDRRGPACRDASPHRPTPIRRQRSPAVAAKARAGQMPFTQSRCAAQQAPARRKRNP